MSDYSVSEIIPATIEHEDGIACDSPAIRARKRWKTSDIAYSEYRQVISTQGSPGKQNK